MLTITSFINREEKTPNMETKTERPFRIALSDLFVKTVCTL